MQIIRHWRMQSTRYRLRNLRPMTTAATPETTSAMADHHPEPGPEIREIIAQPLPIIN